MKNKKQTFKKESTKPFDNAMQNEGNKVYEIAKTINYIKTKQKAVNKRWDENCSRKIVPVKPTKEFPLYSLF